MKYFLIYITIITPLFCFTQNEEDALRYSQSFISGTARNISMGGAMSALGSDFSATSQNPAAMAGFNKNNFSFTTVFENSRTNGKFYNNYTNYNALVGKISNISYLKTYNLPKETSNGWTTLQLGAGYTRINTFENTKRYSGEIDSSIIHHFINEANGTNPDFIFDEHTWGAGLAYDVYAIDPWTDNTYVTQLVGNSNHSRTIYSSGGMGEYSLAASANYQNKLYLGGSINVTRIKYYTNFTHKESFIEQDSIWINSIEYLGNLSTEGWGVNAKIGIIYLPVKNLKLGLAIHTPTRYTLKDLWGNDMRSNTDDTQDPIKFIKDEFKPTGEYDYHISTPFKANFSLGYIYDKKASFGAEIEFIDYGTSKLSSQKFNDFPYSFVSENTQIKNIYRPTLNFKIGGEYRINPMLYLRAGYAFYTSPYSIESGVNTSPTQFVTGGIGINLGTYYLDFAIAHKNVSYNYYAYNPDLKGSTAFFTENNLNFSATVGFRFD